MCKLPVFVFFFQTHCLLCLHAPAAKEAQWQAREERARQQYEKRVEERKKKLEEQRVKEEKRRAAVEEKRRQKTEEDRVLTLASFTTVHPECFTCYTREHTKANLLPATCFQVFSETPIQGGWGNMDTVFVCLTTSFLV